MDGEFLLGGQDIRSRGSCWLCITYWAVTIQGNDKSTMRMGWKIIREQVFVLFCFWVCLFLPQGIIPATPSHQHHHPITHWYQLQYAGLTRPFDQVFNPPTLGNIFQWVDQPVLTIQLHRLCMVAQLCAELIVNVCRCIHHVISDCSLALVIHSSNHSE